MAHPWLCGIGGVAILARKPLVGLSTAGVLSIACRCVHSACETVSLADIEGGVWRLTALAQTKDLASSAADSLRENGRRGFGCVR